MGDRLPYGEHTFDRSMEHTMRHFGKNAMPPFSPDDPISKMNEDWKPGDKAVCINDEWARPLPDDPKKGEILIIHSVQHGTDYVGRPGYFLHFEGKAPERGWHCHAFMKLRPDVKEADEQFKQFIKTTIKAPNMEPA